MKEKLREFLRPRLAVLLAALLLAAYLPAIPAAQAAGETPEDAWEDQEGVINESFKAKPTTLTSYTYSNSEGTTETVTVKSEAALGSKENPISIPDETALILFGKQKNDATQEKCYILDKPDGVYNMGAHTMQPLMGEVPSGSHMLSPDAPFQGVLIGNGARIENVYIKMDDGSAAFGLFGAMEDAEIADLTVSLTSASAGSSVFFAGGLVGGVHGSATLTNCTAEVAGSLTAGNKGYSYAGGLVGYVEGNAALTDCTAKVSGSLTADSYAGGLVGRVSDGATLTNCTAEVAGDLTAGDYGTAGGLVGEVSDGATLTNCTAEVKGSLTAGDYGTAGGLMGYVDSGTVTLTNCTAEVKGSLAADSDAGGLVGVVENGTATLTNCTAKVSGSQTEGECVGGLVGVVEGNATLTDCTAEVTGSLTEGEFVGGLVGFVEGNTALTNCTAEVSGSQTEGEFVGGLVGFVDGDAALTNCAAKVTGSLTADSAAGGLVGFVDGDAALTNCAAEVAGSLTATSEYGDGYAGGLVGGVDGDAALTNCAAQAVITKQRDGSCAPSGPVGYGTATFSGANVTTLRMGAGSSVYLALVNGTTLTLTDTDGLTATGNAAGNGTTGSVEVTSDGGAVIQVHGGSESGGRTYTLTGVNGTIRLEDKTSTEYWVALDAGFTSADPDPLTRGDAVNLLGEAGNRLCTVAVEAGTGGTVSGSGTFDAGTTVTVKAAPNSGYRFVGWTESGQQVSTEASYTFAVTSSRTLTAVFETITPQYTVTVQAGTGGSATGSGSYAAGETVTITATASSGQRFTGWTVNAGGVALANANSATTTFTMPAGNVTVTANFQSNSGGGSSGGDDSYTPPKKDEPQTDSNGGWKDIQKELENAEPGDDVDVTMNGTTEVPKEVLESIAGKDVDVNFDMGGGIVWTINGKDIPSGIGNLNLGIRIGSSSIPVDVFNAITGEKSIMQFTLAHSGPFGMVLHLSLNLGAENHGYWANLYWFDESGKELVFQNSCLIDSQGMASWPFDHASSYAVIIDEKNHDPAPFTDVSVGDWYYDAVRFVNENNLMGGYSNGKFGPNDNLSRAQLAQILFSKEGRPEVNYLLDFSDVAGEAWYTEAIRWAASQGIVGGYGNGTFGPNDPITREQLAVMLWRYSGSPTFANKELHFNDEGEISGYALEAMRWAVENGILNGYGDGRLGPQGQATRAQVAQMLKHFIENQEENI